MLFLILIIFETTILHIVVKNYLLIFSIISKANFRDNDWVLRGVTNGE